jgi:hypothetical protein
MASKSNRPASVKIGVHKYKIKYVSKIFESEDLGRTDNDVALLLVRDGLAPAMERDTLLHEMLHAIWYVSGLDANKEGIEEVYISALTPWLMMVLTDPMNKDFLKYIQQ